MATPESKVKDKIKAICKARGVYYAMPVMGGMASNGTPDFLLCYKGVFVAIEAKAGKGKATPLQLVRLNEIVKAGGIAVIINENNITSFSEILDNVDNGYAEVVLDENFQLVAFAKKK